MLSTSQLQDGFKILNRGGKESLNFIQFKDEVVKLITIKNNSSDVAIIEVGNSSSSNSIYEIKNNVNELQKGLKFFKEGTTEIELKENTIILTSGRKQVIVNIEKSNLKLDIKNEYNNTFKFDFKDFKNRVDAIIPLRGKDSSRPMINGIHFNENHIVALDGFKLGVSIDNETKNIVDPMTLTKSGTDYLVDIMKIVKSDDIIMNTNDNKVKFEFDNVKLISKLFEGSYVNYNDVLRKSQDDTTIIKNMDINKLLDDIKFLESMADIGRLENNILSGLLKNESSPKNKVKLPYGIVEGDEIDISFNLKYMRVVLNSIKKLNDITTICFMGSLNPIMFRNEDSIYLLLPIRLAN